MTKLKDQYQINDHDINFAINKLLLQKGNFAKHIQTFIGYILLTKLLKEKIWSIQTIQRRPCPL